MKTPIFTFAFYLLIPAFSVAQSLAGVNIGGVYYSSDTYQIQCYEKIVSPQYLFSDKLSFKAGFLFNRLNAVNFWNNNTYNISNNKANVIVFPNPAISQINYYLPPTFRVKRVNIFSIEGKLMYSGLQNSTISIANFKPGYYILSLLLEDDSIINTQFIKM